MMKFSKDQWKYFSQIVLKKDLSSGFDMGPMNGKMQIFLGRVDGG